MARLRAPQVNKKDLKKYLERHYKLGRLLSIKKFKKGLANHLYLLTTEKGKFSLKIAIRNNSERLDYEIKLLNSIKNLPVPRPVRTIQGVYIFNYKNHRSFIYPYLPGKEEKVFSSKMLYEIGRFLGRLHLQTEKFRSSVNRIKFYHCPPSYVRGVVRRSSKIRNKKIREALVYIKKNAAKYQIPKGLPKGGIHTDVKPENTLFDRGKLSGVVDFDNSYIDALISDLANTLMWFSCIKGEMDFEKAKAIYQGYISVRKLSAREEGSMYIVFRNIFYGITAHCIDYVAEGKLPEKYAVWVIDNLLNTEKNLMMTKEEFMALLS